MFSGTLTAARPAVHPLQRVVARVRAAFANPVQAVRLGLFLVCVAALVRTSADPDLWGHVRFGGDIVAAHHVALVDRYSFTSDRPWVNHEWLAEVLMYGAWRALGSAGLMALKLPLVLGVLLLAVRRLRLLDDVMTRDRFTALLAMAILSRTFTLRPQVFSLFLFALLLSLLAAVDRGRRRALVGVPLVMAAWVNLHGGWLVGLGVLGVWLAFRCLDRRASWKLRGALAAAGVTAVAATLLNPYGFGMWRFLWDTVGVPRPEIADWQPMYMLPFPLIALWALVFGVGALIVVRAGRSNDWAYVSMTGLLALMSFRLSRVDAFFAIAVVLLLAPQLPLRARTRRAVAPATPARLAPALFLAALSAVPAAVFLAQTGGAIAIGDGFPEAAAVRFMRANHLRGRMIVWFGWGEYAIWHLWPDIAVSIDGRRETVYSEATIDANWLFAVNAEPAALGYADRVRADFVWVPSNVPIARVLRARGWIPVFAGRLSTVFARQAAGPYVDPPSMASARDFPGP